jgi:hypothetical protein
MPVVHYLDMLASEGNVNPKKNVRADYQAMLEGKSALRYVKTKKEWVRFKQEKGEEKVIKIFSSLSKRFAKILYL